MLAYNHFVESLFVLNDCHEGLHASTSAAGMQASQSQAGMRTDGIDSSMAHLRGASAAARANRDAIYT